MNVLDYGAIPDGLRLTGVIANAGSATVTVSDTNFTQANRGKLVLIYTDTGAGIMATILSIQSSTQ